MDHIIEKELILKKFIEEKQAKGWILGEDQTGDLGDYVIFNDCKECYNDNNGCDSTKCDCDCHVHCQTCGEEISKTDVGRDVNYSCKSCKWSESFVKSNFM